MEKLSNYWKPMLLNFAPATQAQTIEMWEMCVGRIRKRTEVVKTATGDADRSDIISHLLEPKAQGQGMSVPEIESTAWTLLFNGAESTASALTAAISYLLQKPAKLQKLTAEIREKNKSAEDISFSSTAGLTYLNAVLHETLRLASPISGVSPRVIDGEGVVIAGVQVPKGVSTPI